MRPFTVRESARARHVRLHLSLAEGLVVVVPRGFDMRRLPQMLADKAEWVEKAWARLTAKGVRKGPNGPSTAALREPPRSIALEAVGETWTVTYRRTRAAGVTVKTSGCSGLAYQLEYVDEAAPEDVVFENHGVKLLIDPKSLAYLDGTELDFVREGLNEGFKFNNPKERDRCGCGESFRV